MQQTPSERAVVPIRQLVFTYVFIGLSSSAYRFLSGQFDLLPWGITDWIICLGIALILEYGRRLSFPLKRARMSAAVVFVPALLQMGSDMSLVFYYRAFTERSFLRIVIFALNLLVASLMIVAVRRLVAAYHEHAQQSSLASTVPRAEGIENPSSDNSINEKSTSLLGRGDSYVDRVIKSVVARSVKSERAASFSLGVMMVLVMVGGMASVGLWALTHADRISSLEAERNKLIALQDGLREAQEKVNAGGEDAKIQLTRLINFIDQNYKADDTYKATITRLSQQTQTNAADIAIRVTIAVLTIFLVQVFFSVYKYNHHSADILAAKAEAIELAGNDADAKKRLSNEAANIVREGVPGFGSPPRTPVDAATRLAERFTKPSSGY